MGAHTHTMAACLADADLEWTRPDFWGRQASRSTAVNAILIWQRAKACVDQREAMQIVDDKTLDHLSQLEHEARIAARSACEAVGLEWRNLGDLG